MSKAISPDIRGASPPELPGRGEEVATLSIRKTETGYDVLFIPPGKGPAALTGVAPVGPEDRLDLLRNLDATTELINRSLEIGFSRRGINVAFDEAPHINSLRTLGQLMHDLLIPDSIRTALSDLQSPLIITTNDAEIPWELLHDGNEFLGTKQPVSRRLALSQPPRRPKEYRTRPLRFLLVANPLGDLPASEQEAYYLYDALEQQGITANILRQDRAKYMALCKALRSGEYDVVHYTGHAYFNSRFPERSGLRLAGNRVLPANQIEKILGGAPLVFLNACSSGREAGVDARATQRVSYVGPQASGLASAFISGGALAFIGAQWPIFDEASREFALHFYERLFEGETIGEALRLTKVRMRAVRPTDATWASFILYGDPMLRIVRSTSLDKPSSLTAEAIEISTAKRREVTQFSWTTLRDMAWRISTDYGEAIRKKHTPELYLQRDQIKKVFDDFMASGKTCFVLIGKSGVGKSSFVASIMEAMENRPDVCVLAYDGSGFSNTRLPLARTITKDFETRLVFKGVAEPDRSRDIFYAISRIDGIERKKVLLIIDAINENDEAHTLLQLVNAFVRDHAPPWLKVIITSRPQAWYMMKRGVTLAAQRYYRRRDTDQIEVEIEPFGHIEAEVEKYLVRLREFTPEELPKAYKKYQHKYRIKTEYECLSPSLRQELRDPLKLYLIAQMHEGKSIPADMRVSGIHEDYVEFLLATGRLHPQDVFFLDKVMHLMISKGRYRKAITGGQIAEEGDLRESIWADMRLRSGYPRNVSFVHLQDAEILRLKGSALDYTIDFKFERFYDYFAGKRLFQLNQSAVDPESNYRQLIELELQKQPFLWGAIKNALLHELKSGNQELITKLAFTRIPEQKEILANALREHGEEEPAEARSILVQLMGLRAERRAAMHQTGQFLATKGSALTVESLNAKELALEVASTLEVEPVLEAGTRDASETVRAHAVRNVFYLWQRNPEAGFRLLRRLTSGFTPQTAFLNRHLLEAGLEVSLLILMNNYKSQPVIEEMLAIWRPALRSLFFYEGLDEGLRKLRVTVRTWMLGQISRYLLRRTYNPKYNVPGNIRELACFFGLPEEQKHRFGRLVPYLDPSQGRMSEIEADILQAARDGDVFTAGITTILLLLRGLHGEYEDALRLMKEVFDIGMESDPPNVWAPAVIFGCFRLTDAKGAVQDDALSLVRYMVETFYDRRSDLHCQVHLSDSYVGLHNLASYAVLYFKKHGSVRVDLMQKYAAKALDEHDVNLARSFILDMESLLKRRRWDLFQEGLTLILPFEDEAIQHGIVELLGIARLYYPNEVENFMHETEFSDKEKLRVKAVQPKESLYQLVGEASSIMAVDAFQIPVIKKELIKALLNAINCRSLNEWILLVGKRSVNMIYGEEVFPSKQSW